MPITCTRTWPSRPAASSSTGAWSNRPRCCAISTSSSWTTTRAVRLNRLWLQAARTARARSAIERYLKRQGQGSHHGQKIIDERLQDLERHYGFNLPAERIEQAMMEAVRRENLSSKDDLLAAIAGGQFAVDRIFHRIFEHEILRQVGYSCVASRSAITSCGWRNVAACGPARTLSGGSTGATARSST